MSCQYYNPQKLLLDIFDAQQDLRIIMVYAKIIDNSKVLKTVSNISYESVLSFILVVNNQPYVEYTEYQCRYKEIVEITFKDINKTVKLPR